MVSSIISIEVKVKVKVKNSGLVVPCMKVCASGASVAYYSIDQRAKIKAAQGTVLKR